MKPIRSTSLILFFTALLVLSCGLPMGLLEESRPPTATLPATQPGPTETAPQPDPVITQPAPGPLTVTAETIQEERKEPPSPYVIDLQYPVFSGAPEASAAGLNEQVQALVARQRAQFEEMVNTTPADPQIGPHGLQMRYEVRHNDGRYVSLYFMLSVYSSGAAHPLPFSETLNYDVAQNRVLTLADLFQPNSDYLAVISQKSLAWLQNQGITGGESGAAPTPENYRNWNITAEGLLITFDPYQVAAYAVGFVPVTIPWSDLADILAIQLSS